MRKPYYFKQKKCWYVKSESGKNIRLDPDEAEAYRIWQSMIDARSSLNHPRVTVRQLFREWYAQHRPQLGRKRLVLVRTYIFRFARDFGSKPANQITPAVVIEWVSVQTKPRKKLEPKPWSDWAKHDAMACVKRVFAWAHQEGYLPKHHLAGLKLKKPRGRKRTITDEEHARLVEAARQAKRNGPEFALYLIASHCGARPQQIREVTAANVHASGQCWVFSEHKTDETGEPLFVYLSPCLQTITRLLIARHPTGPLFRQDDGSPWSKDTIALKLRRLRRDIGLGDDIVAYSYRHTFATHALLAEVPIATVSALLGHKDTRMVSQVYGHLGQHSDHLLDAVQKAQKKRHE